MKEIIRTMNISSTRIAYKRESLLSMFNHIGLHKQEIHESNSDGSFQRNN